MSICYSCLRRLAINQTSSVQSLRSTVRRFAGTSRSSEPASNAAPSGSPGDTSTASSTIAAQSTTSLQKGDETPKSCIPAGTALKGMAYLKNKEPPMALEDHEYPEWLWGLLKTQKGGQDGATDAEGDIYCKWLS